MKNPTTRPRNAWFAVLRDLRAYTLHAKTDKSIRKIVKFELENLKMKEGRASRR